jgi:hypothetical protein
LENAVKNTMKRFRRLHRKAISTAEELKAALTLDEALWTATSAEVDTLNCDPVFLEHLDLDRNGKVMCFELKAAADWLFHTLEDLSGVSGASNQLEIEALRQTSSEGARIGSAMKRILRRLGKAEGRTVSLSEVRRIKTEAEQMPISEAGVVLPEAAGEPELRQFVTDILQTVGGVPHPSGREGVNTEKLAQFREAMEQYLAWKERGRIGPDDPATVLMPLGAKTAEAFEILRQMQRKIDEYYTLCRVAALKSSLGQLLSKQPEIGPPGTSDPAALEAFLLEAPLAAPTEEMSLSFKRPFNPSYAEQMAALRKRVVEPLAGEINELSEQQWRQIKHRFIGYGQWEKSKTGEEVERLGEAKLEEYLDPRYSEELSRLLKESSDTALVLDDIRLIEKLILYQMGMLRLANNFISFSCLFAKDCETLFDIGTLIIDGRRFNMIVTVRDRARHAQISAMSRMFVVYLEILSPGGTKSQAAIPVTSGRRGNLYVGKRGIFQDNRGSESSAEVVQVIENPISIGEALVGPFKRLGRLVTGKLEKLTSSAEQQLDKAVKGDLSLGQAVPTSEGKTPLGSMLLGGSLAIAALGSAVAFITKSLSEVPWYIILAVFVGMVMMVLLPTFVVSLIKLKRRDLSAILEASGWAINTRMRLTLKQGRHFTRQPRRYQRKK